MTNSDIDVITLSDNEFEDRLRFVVDEDLSTILMVLKRKIDLYNDNLQRIDYLSHHNNRRSTMSNIRSYNSLEVQNRELLTEIDIIKRQYKIRLDNVIYGTRGRRYRVIETMSDMLMNAILLLESISNLDMRNMTLITTQYDALQEEVRKWNMILQREYWKMGILNRIFTPDDLGIVPIKINDMNIVREILGRTSEQLSELEEYWGIEVLENLTPTIDPSYHLIQL